ncbi:MAG: PadR family transcriptional regulator [Anaerolineae bacterium]|nr:PadR family transcriptional regulator [Anaerolineae bacterium]
MERELLLLGLLQKEEMHGYQLHEFIDSFMQTCVDLKKSTAYYLLEKMAKEGYVTRTEEREGNRPPRRVYHLTAAGEECFLALLRQNLASYLPATFAGDTGLTFLDNLPASEAVSLLEQRRAQLAEAVAAIERAPLHTGTLQFMIEHQQVHLQSELAWLDSVIARLSNEE